ncbi:MAG TPA: STELLO glycosyltransferase family protein [Flavobacteriales bacterium]|nr:STELLO glycosyltransferase family protein [Flavobacteriales bacterium]
MSHTTLVITSIAAPNAVLRAFADGCTAKGIDFVLIGDKPSPTNFSLPGCDFWSLERQQEMPFALARLLPERHYGRKNLGYLQAIKQGAQVILESDDDNFPRPTFWDQRTREQHTASLVGTGWVNLYRYFSQEPVWPRGFPLEHLQDPIPVPPAGTSTVCPIQQGLADENPDVDAIYRLVGRLPLNFEPRELPVSLGAGALCPFNSQNTTWFREAFPLLYLPSYCSFRMTDIWRSYVAVRICWENGWDVLFHNATVWQERNAHDLMKDFADELIGYQHNKAITARLAALALKAGPEHIGANMKACYAEFMAMGLIGTEETALLDAWLADLSTLG